MVYGPPLTAACDCRLHYAAQQDSNLDLVLYLLGVAGPRQLSVADAAGCWPVHLAAASNTSESVLVYLLAVGGQRQLSAKDHAGRRPLHYAATFNSSSLAPLKYLVQVRPFAFSVCFTRVCFFSFLSLVQVGAGGGGQLFSAKDGRGLLPIHGAAQQ